MADGPTPEERRFHALANGTQERIAELDSKGRAVYLSHDEPEVGSLDVVHPDDRDRVARHFTTAFAEGTCERTSYRVTDPDGSERWIESTISPFAAEDDRHLLVVSRDVTAARRTELELRESRARFRRIAETAYDMIVEFDADWRVLYANQRVREVLGFRSAGRYSAARSVHPEDREAAARVLDRVSSGATDFVEATFRTRHADGSWRWVDVSFRALEREDGERHVLAIGRDVSDRIEAERSLRESENRYRELVESAPLGIFVVREGRVVYANPAGASLAGADDPGDLHGLDLTRMLSPDDSRHVVDRMREAPEGARTNAIDFEIVGLDGERRRVQGAATLTTYAGEPAFQAILRDVTELEQSRRERERLQLQLQEARKLESLGVLAGGIAHDFNNLLAVILSNVRYARDPKTGDAERDEALTDAEDAAESAARLVRQLLAYAGRREPEVRHVELSELVGSVTDLLGTAVPHGVAMQLDLAPEPLSVHVDLVQLEQVLMNLVLNAADALGDRAGRVVVRTGRTRLDDVELAGWRCGDDLAGGDYACLEVEDDGSGMSEEVCNRIFDPFFTTKAEGHGLGLSAVLGMVQGHRGAIRVESAPGRGTRIRIALPLEPGEPLRGERPSPLVLLAESDAAMRDRLEALLAEQGARVVQADGAESALGLYAMHGEELDAAVISAELVAPDAAVIAAQRAAPDASPLASALHDARPSLPIGLCRDDAALPPALRALAAIELPRGGGDALLGERLRALLVKCTGPSGGAL